jgi:hypothetical protein
VGCLRNHCGLRRLVGLRRDGLSCLGCPGRGTLRFECGVGFPDGGRVRYLHNQHHFRETEPKHNYCRFIRLRVHVLQLGYLAATTASLYVQSRRQPTTYCKVKAIHMHYMHHRSMLYQCVFGLSIRGTHNHCLRWCSKDLHLISIVALTNGFSTCCSSIGTGG